MSWNIMSVSCIELVIDIIITVSDTSPCQCQIYFLELYGGYVQNSSYL